MDIVLSCFQVEPILQAIKLRKSSVETSLDLGLSLVTVKIQKDFVLLPDGQQIGFEDLKRVSKRQNQVFLVENSQIRPINVYSEKTGWMRTLYPTKGAPTTLVSGILMHRIKDIDPYESAKQMVASLLPMKNLQLLDTATGLGYAAIEAAKSRANVTTVEIDPAALEIARLNPWSKPLFESPKIRSIEGDILEEVDQFKDNQFDRILHDPPTLKLSGELYSLEFYKKLFRVLKPQGKLFHYIGDPDSEHGDRVTKGVIERLKTAGFKNIQKNPQNFGLSATK